MAFYLNKTSYSHLCTLDPSLIGDPLDHRDSLCRDLSKSPSRHRPPVRLQMSNRRQHQELGNAGSFKKCAALTIVVSARTHLVLLDIIMLVTFTAKLEGFTFSSS